MEPFHCCDAAIKKMAFHFLFSINVIKCRLKEEIRNEAVTLLPPSNITAGDWTSRKQHLLVVSQVDLLRALTYCCSAVTAHLHQSSFPLSLPASAFISSHWLSSLLRLPSSSEAIYSTFERILNSTITCPSAPQ